MASSVTSAGIVVMIVVVIAVKGDAEPGRSPRRKKPSPFA
jgi:hypothetical protein